MECKCGYVNRLISDLHKEVSGYSYIEKSATYESCLIMRLNTSLRTILPFKSEYYSTFHIAGIALSISKSTPA